MYVLCLLFHSNACLNYKYSLYANSNKDYVAFDLKEQVN